MVLNYKYRLYGNTYSRQLSDLVTTANHVYNHVVALYRRYYSLYHKNPSTGAIKHHIAKLAKHTKGWDLMGSQSLQEICERIDNSYKEFFKKKGRGRPSFHKSLGTGSFCFKGSVGYTLDGNVLRVNKLGKKYRFKLTRPYGAVRNIRIKRDSRGYLWLVICTDVPSEPLERRGDALIGVDFGLKHFITASDGTVINAPQYYKAALSTLRKLDRNLSHKVKGSNSRKAAKVRRAKAYEHIANQRSDFQWKLAHKLCSEHSLIAIEDLNMKAMQKRWGRKISDLGWYEFTLKLEHIARKYGTKVVKVDRYAATSQTCSACGYKNPETKDLRVREWTCPVCGAHHDRDVNAAVNILNVAIGGKDVSLDQSHGKTGPACAGPAVAATV